MSEKIEKSTQLANDIESAREEARYDAACKKVLSNKSILAWILSFLQPLQNSKNPIKTKSLKESV